MSNVRVEIVHPPIFGDLRSMRPSLIGPEFKREGGECPMNKCTKLAEETHLFVATVEEAILRRSSAQRNDVWKTDGSDDHASFDF
jgi:hypothetical protein